MSTTKVRYASEKHFAPDCNQLVILQAKRVRIENDFKEIEKQNKLCGLVTGLDKWGITIWVSMLFDEKTHKKTRATRIDGGDGTIISNLTAKEQEEITSILSPIWKKHSALYVSMVHYENGEMQYTLHLKDTRIEK